MESSRIKPAIIVVAGIAASVMPSLQAPPGRPATFKVKRYEETDERRSRA
jgi:hypothetical protein